MKTLILKTKPIPSNQLYRCFRNHNIISSKAREAKKGLAAEAREKWNGPMFTEELCVNMILYFGDKRKRDIDAYLKVVLDSLNGICYEDDSLINELHVFKLIDVENPRVEISFL